MKLTFFGACDSVTGSCYLLEANSARVLIDCGLYQGNKELRERNEAPFPFVPESINHVILTHAHIDHSGLLPKLVREGFRGKIFATHGTVSLCEIMLRDSGHIHEMEAEWQNRKGKRAASAMVSPLYTVQDAEASLKRFSGVAYAETQELAPGMQFTLHDAGHILGSSMVELVVTEGEKEQRIVFSGDLGERGRPIIADPTRLSAADIVIVESTYGDRLHSEITTRRDELRAILLQAVAESERVIIPAFAVGRTQDVLYEINELYRSGDIPLIPVYVDSPLAIAATDIFKQYKEYYDAETAHRLKERQSPFEYPALHFTHTAEGSKALNGITEACVIISASGMCEAGRIKHHLKHNLWRPGAHILFVGYQGEGTLGRRIRDGAPYVTLFGEEIAVKAHIHAIEGLSAHADQQGLMWWMRGFTKKPRQVFVTHGEVKSRRAFANLIKEELGLAAEVPTCNTRYDLESGARGELVTAAQGEARQSDELDTLWRQARAALYHNLKSGNKGEIRHARKLAEKLKNLLCLIRDFNRYEG